MSEPQESSTTQDQALDAVEKGVKVPDLYNVDASKFKIVDPLDHFTDAEKKKLSEMRALSDKWVHLGPEEKEFMSDQCLFRFLKGYAWNVSEAIVSLKETVEWRKDYKPQHIQLKDVESVAKQGYIYTEGFDKEGRPIIYIHFARDKIKSDKESVLMKFKHMAFVMEEAIRRMPKGVYNIVFIVDLKGCNISLSLVKQCKDLFTKLGDYYTERLAKNICIKAPWTINIIWSFLKKVMAPTTVKKYNFISTSKPAELKKQFLEYMEEDQLVKEYQGTNNFEFNWEKELKKDEERLAYEKELENAKTQST